MQKKLGSIPIIARPVPKGQVYPISPEELKARLEKLPKDDLKGLKGVEFVPPKTAQQEDSWAQMLRGKRKMLIFSQPVAADGRIAGKNPAQVREHMVEYVIPHEIGHHKALYLKRITDKDLSMAEARADAYAYGMSVTDRDAKLFQDRHR
jgi:hypothetical protein